MNKAEHTTAADTTGDALYYQYSQNNSGGSFDIDDAVAPYVIIQAVSARHADQRAIDIGIYFDGCDTGQDCSCCGDRWSTTWSNGTKTPLIYDKDPATYKDMFAVPGMPICHVYHLDGSKTTYRAPKGGAK